MTAESPPEVSLDDQCPRCGQRFQPFQEYCLECGSRLPGSYTHGRPVSRTSRRWLWATIVALLLVALVAGAIVAVTATDNGSDQAAGPKAPGIRKGTAARAKAVPVPATTGLRLTRAARAKAARAAPATWPSGKSGYTVVLLSIETSAGRAGAATAVRNAIKAGLPDVGVLDSSGFSSIRSGFYVVFSGVYDTIQEANSALAAVRSSGYELAYPREITPKSS